MGKDSILWRFRVKAVRVFEVFGAIPWGKVKVGILIFFGGAGGGVIGGWGGNCRVVLAYEAKRR